MGNLKEMNIDARMSFNTLYFSQYSKIEGLLKREAPLSFSGMPRALSRRRKLRNNNIISLGNPLQLTTCKDLKKKRVNLHEYI
jgi:hypothetical protein